jgi:hypothetical protein
MDANLEEMRACLGAVEACLGKTETTVKAGQEQMRAELRLAWKELRPESEANQEKLETLMEPYKWVPRVKATHVLATAQVRASMLYMETLKEQCTRRLLQ